ncbi:MAG: endo alpha-1,4 polygalactosaminidase [Verrucomicrobiae bacterium]|nr:endo alpha-1,4 polygalactosaminidase [Verrucomicrobiae bacterium]
MNRSSLTFLTTALTAICAFVSTAFADDANSLYVDYSTEPIAQHLLAHDLSILAPDATADLAAGQKLGNRYLAYVSLVEIAADASYREHARQAGIHSLLTNPNWNSEAVDTSDPAWRKFVIEKLARPAVESGFDGFFLDTADSVRLISEKHPERAEAFREGLLTLIRELKKTWPGKSLVINRGFDLLPDLGPDIIDGVLVESVFRSFDPATREYTSVEPSLTKTLVGKIEALRKDGYPVYVVDYVKPGDKETVADTEAQIRALGAIPFLTTPDLDGTISAGGLVARRLLVLFGHDPVEAERHRIWPADTTTHEILQMPLEYHGYEIDYHDVGQGLPPIGEGPEYAGIILDEELELPYETEHAYADWLLDRVDAGKKVLFLGSYAFSDHHERTRIFERLGIRGSDDTPVPVGEPEISVLDESVMGFESKPIATRRDFENLSAPEGARVLLSLDAKLTEDENSPVARYDTAYVASWGGALLSPYIVFEASEETVLEFADPFAFLGQIWPAGAFPAPDPTTRDGLRVFYTHIDGDGFSSVSAVEPGKTCAEVLTNELLQDLPWPITVSVVESEIRGQMLAQARGEGESLTAIAKKLFALPNVEPASHSYSHPYVWHTQDVEFEGLYEEKNMALKLTAKYPQIDQKRETIDSLHYVTDELSPKDKPAELMLWSGNCRPSPEALRLLREAGYENMNGGNTIICRRFPGLFGVAPRTITWDDELQINAANQNEYIYTGGWNGPTWGGFSQVIETFEMTETPRRLKPVNVYYHFYSAERHDAFAALKEIYDWCRTQDLHAMTALQFAKITRDSWGTKLVQTGNHRWVALNEGRLRTFRVPGNAGFPDLAHSDGVIGYRRENGQLYVHTDGRPRITLQLASDEVRHPRIETASTEIQVSELTADTVKLQVADRPASLQLAGFAPNQTVSVTIDRLSETHETNAVGQLKLELPAGASTTLQTVHR